MDALLPPPWNWITITLLAWITLTSLWRFIAQPWISRQLTGEIPVVACWILVRIYARLVHRTTYEGRECVPADANPGPLIVVSNHTGSVDPLLIQAGVRFRIEWMMAQEMMSPALAWLWEPIAKIIPVARDGKDLGPAREAMRRVKNGSVVGIFPEGRIVNPPEQVWPFFNGVGLMIARTKAPVLLVWVRDTPRTTSMNTALSSRSRAKVSYLGLFDFTDVRDPAAITETLRSRVAEVSGWPINDNPPPLGETSTDPDRFNWFRSLT